MKKPIGQLRIVKEGETDSFTGWFIMHISDAHLGYPGYILANKISDMVEQVVMTQDDLMRTAGNMDDVLIRKIIYK